MFHKKLITSVKLLFAIFIVTYQYGCKKLIEIPAPATSVNQQNVYDNDQTAISVLNGIYTSLQADPSTITGIASISLLAGLSADELTLFDGVSSTKYQSYYRNALSQQSGAGAELWPLLYKHVFYCNAAIEGLNNSINNLTPVIKGQLLGEAKFIRALLFVNLVNLYGDVPLPLTTNWQENEKLRREPIDSVYKRISLDLSEAENLLPSHFKALDGLSNTTERIRPTKDAAMALLARVYLYTKNWTKAEEKSTSIINNSTLFSLESIENTFKKNSNDAIWQMQPIQGGWNTQDARNFIIQPTGPTDINGSSGQPVFISPNLLNSFEPNDLRRKKWIDSVSVSGNIYFFPAKYISAILNAPLTEYLSILRVSEQYLIRAEARAQQNNISSGQSDLNAIRNRAGLTNTTANDKASLLAAIINERQTELFTEQGHRWIDLKRTNTIDAIMNVVTPQKANGAAWQSYQQLFPIPLADIQKSPNLTQNVGY